MKSEKNKQNTLTKRVCHRSLPIDRYNRFNQIRFTDFYRLTTPGIIQCVALKPITSLRRLLSQCFGGKEIGFLFNC